MLRWLFAALHLLALGIGLGAVWARSRALAQVSNRVDLQRAFTADNWWGIAAVLWLVTGLARLFFLEKGTAYYFHNGLFLAKMGLFVTIFLLELAPMITLIRWRAVIRRGGMPELTRAPTFARISLAEAMIVIAMIAAATGMARGYGAF
jgi:putative membrane protein